MKRLASFLGVMAVTALVTYLLVADYYRREKVNTLRRELEQAQSDLAWLQGDWLEAQRDLSVRRDFRLNVVPRATNAESPPATTKVPTVAVYAAAQTSAVIQDNGTAAGDINEWPAVPVAVPVGAWASYEPDMGSRCSVQGTSRNGQRWEIQGRAMGGFLDLDPRLRIGATAVSNLSVLGSNIAARGEVVIPVRTLKSQAPIGAGIMDQQVQAVLEAARYPRISFRLHRLTLWPSTNSAALHFLSEGALAIHGRTNQIELPVSIARQQGNRLQVSGMIPVNMSHYRVVPPLEQTPAGLDQAEDEVWIYFDWIVQRSSTSPPELAEEGR